MLAFERIYGSILGSQINLLYKLSELRTHGMDTNAINQYFDQVKARYPELGQWSNVQYLKFLFDNSLVHHDDGKVYITESGIEFLIWLIKNGPSKVKPL